MWIFNRIEIWEFDLETPWDIESASVNKHRVFKGEDGVVRGHDFDFSSDGKNLFIDDRGAAKIGRASCRERVEVEVVGANIEANELDKNRNTFKGVVELRERD